MIVITSQLINYRVAVGRAIPNILRFATLSPDGSPHNPATCCTGSVTQNQPEPNILLHNNSLPPHRLNLDNCIYILYTHMSIGFEWDAAKNLTNQAKHGIDFADATRMCDNPFFEIESGHRKYVERRLIAVGPVDKTVLAVVYTPRGRNRRIISARRARKNEQTAYREAFPENQTKQD